MGMLPCLFPICVHPKAVWNFNTSYTDPAVLAKISSSRRDKATMSFVQIMTVVDTSTVRQCVALSRTRNHNAFFVPTRTMDYNAESMRTTLNNIHLQ